MSLLPFCLLAPYFLGAPCLPPASSSAVFATATAQAHSVPALPLADSPPLLQEDSTGAPLVLALDEMAVRDPATGAHKIEKIPPQPDAAEWERFAAARATADNREIWPVLYPPGLPRTVFTRRLLTPEITLKFSGPPDSSALARLATHAGASLLELPAYAPGFAVLRAAAPLATLGSAATLRAAPGVLAAIPVLARQQGKRLVPNDTLFTQQWHLRNTGQESGSAGQDINVVPVWDTYQGDGVRIGIVDDGLQTSHPDLSANVDTTNDYDWNGADSDPSPNLATDFHGTSCAGVAAARGSNSLGGSGAAPRATLVGLRLISDVSTDTTEAAAFAHRNDIIAIKSNSWGPNDDGATLEGPGPLALAALANGVATGRGGKGLIYVWAGGNGLESLDNSNYDGYANSIYTIAIAAMDDNGGQAYYSESGANLVVSTPSSSDGLHQGIVTTDLTGSNGYNSGSEPVGADYTNSFGGTSSATPLASGAIALMLQANPNLGWRDVQEILIRTAAKNSPADSDWATNSAGFHFNHKFGAGRLDAQAAVTAALSWTNLAAATSVTVPVSGPLPASIPDNFPTGVTRTFTVSENLRAEQVVLTLSATHSYRGDLTVELTSPSGMKSVLAETHDDGASDYTSWKFMSVRNWGESTAGTWTLKISDGAPSDTGSLTAASLTLFGVPSTPVNQPPAITAATLAPSTSAYADESLSVTSVTTSDPEGDAVSIAYLWQFSTDGSVYADQTGAVSPALPASASNSGKLWRCRLTPSDATSPGPVFYTSALPVNNRPVLIAYDTRPYSYDSDLVLAGVNANFTRSALLNEFSQGNGGSKEWIEILVLKDNTDARGWTLADRSSGTITFSQNILWSALPAGTLVVVHNGADKDTILPATDTDLADRRLVIPHNNSTYFDAGSTWPALSNSSQEIIVLRNSSNSVVDALSFNGETTHNPRLATVGASKAAAYQSDTEAGVDSAASWIIGSASSTFATPGAGNGGANTAFVAALRNGTLNQPALYRLGSASQTPSGLALDASTGIFSGIVSQPSGGDFPIVIERYSGSRVVSQSFTLTVVPLDLTDPDADSRPNLLEYALSTNPLVTDLPAGAPRPQIQNLTVGGSSADYLTLTFRERTGGGGTQGLDWTAQGVRYLPQTSTDLLTWNSGSGYLEVVQVTPDTDGQTEQVTIRLKNSIPSSGERQFLRLTVTMP